MHVRLHEGVDKNDINHNMAWAGVEEHVQDLKGLWVVDGAGAEAVVGALPMRE